MSEAKEDYEKLRSHITLDIDAYNVFDKSDPYIKELEEREKEMIKAMLTAYETFLNIKKYNKVDYGADRWLRPVIEKIAGKPIDEVLNEN